MALDPVMTASLAKIGGAAAMTLAAVGSALGAGAAGMAAVGAWKKCYATGKAAPFLLLTFVGAPLTQTIYGMILMFRMNDAAAAGAAYPGMIGTGIFAGLAIGMSAWMQGLVAAAGSHAFAETREGFTNYLAALGIVETVAIFTMIFSMLTLA